MRAYKNSAWCLMLCVMWASTAITWAQGEMADTVQPLGESLTLDGRVVGMALNADDTRLAVIDESKAFSLFDTTTGERLSQSAIEASDLFVEGGVHYSPDGSLIAVASFAGVRVFDGELGLLQYELITGVDDLTFSLDGTQLYILTQDRIMAHEAQTGAVLSQLQVAAVDDGRQASDLEILKEGSFALLRPDESFNYYVTSISADQSSASATSIVGLDLLAGSAAFATVYYTNLTAYSDLNAAGTPMNAEGPCSDYAGVDFNADGSLLAAVAGGCALHIFDTDTGAQRYLEPIADASRVAFGSSRLYVSAGATVRAYSVSQGNAESTPEQAAAESAPEQAAPDQTATESAEAMPAQRYQFAFNTRIGPDGVGFAGVAISPQGDKIAAIAGFDSLIIAWNSADYSEIGRYTGFAGSRNINYSADGTYLIAINADELMLIFDANTMALLGQLQLTGNFMSELVADVSSAYFYSRTDNSPEQYLNRVDLASASLTAQVLAFVNNTSPNYLGLLPDGNLIGSGPVEEGNAIKTWDTSLNELSAINPGWWGVEYVRDYYLYWTARRGDQGTIYTYNRQDTLEDSATVLGEDLCLLTEFATSAQGSFAVGLRFNCAMILFNLGSGQIDDQIMGEGTGSHAVLSPDDATLYVATRNGIEIYNIVASPA